MGRRYLLAGQTVAVHVGDCREVLAEVADDSVDAVVTDPPYELGFMGRAWDASGVAYDLEVWRQCWRVLKPGGHLLAFGGTRTYHRMACAIEDAGFEVRDSLHWIYGSGFPKGTDLAKAIDRRRDDRADVLKVTAWLAAARDAAGWTTKRIDDLFGFNGMASHWTAITSKAAAVPTLKQWDRLRAEIGFDDAEIRPLVSELNGRKGEIGEAWTQREVVGRRHSGLHEGATSVFLSGTTGRAEDGTIPITAPASEAARRWQGWNTSLKPAHEPIVLARKPTGFDTTVANVLRHGTGALNIDACRTQAGQDYRGKCASVIGLDSNRNGDTYSEWTGPRADSAHQAGRWPTNILFTHDDSCVDQCVDGCPVAELDRQSGSTGAHAASRGAGAKTGYANGWTGRRQAAHGDEGGASRFFPVFRYEAKAPKSERPRLPDGTTHTTVKPLALMRWLVRLITPPGGLVLDPFAGSGTTGEACTLEGLRALLIEQDPAHADLIKARLDKPLQPTLDLGEPA